MKRSRLMKKSFSTKENLWFRLGKVNGNYLMTVRSGDEIIDAVKLSKTDAESLMGQIKTHKLHAV